MTKKYNTGIWDDMHYFFNEYNDHMVHAAFYFDGHINENVLKAAVKQIVGVLPILGCKYVPNDKKSYWEEVENYNVSDWVKVVSTEDISQVEKFLSVKIDELTEPQLKIQIIRSEKKDAVAILSNHQVMDGRSFTEMLNMLADTYTNLLEDNTYKLNYVDGDRSFGQIYRDMKFKDKFKTWLRLSQGKKNNKKTGFPFETLDKKNLTPQIHNIKLDEEYFIAMKKYAKAKGYTINDVVTAGYFMALFDIINSEPNDEIELDIVIDLRRYIKNIDNLGMSNYVATTRCSQTRAECPDMVTAAKLFSEKMKENMADFPGLSGISRLFLGFAIFPFKTTKKLVLKQFNNPLIATSNIGVINPHSFGKLNLDWVYMTGSIKFPPYTLLSVTTFKNVMNFTIASYATQKDGQLIDKLLEKLTKNLKEYKNLI